MDWYGREKLTKYYSVGFTEKELQEINAVYENEKNNVLKEYFKRRTNLIRHLALTCIDLEKENRNLKNSAAESLTKQAKRNTENTMFREVIEKLNDVGKQIAFKQLQALLEAGYVESSSETWTGYYHGIEREGNIVFPKWG